MAIRKHDEEGHLPRATVDQRAFAGLGGPVQDDALAVLGLLVHPHVVGDVQRVQQTCPHNHHSSQKHVPTFTPQIYSHHKEWES